MKIKEMYEKLSRMYPEELSCGWDNDGLMCCSDVNREVKRILVTLDVTDEAVCEAVNGGYDLIISHHPLIFKPISALNIYGNVSCKLIKLIKNEISVMSFHTRLDAAEGGVNDVLTDLLEISEVEKFSDGQEIIGRIGYVEKTSLNEFALFVKKKLNSPFVLAAGNMDREVRRIAVVGGDGKDYIKAAKISGADTYVTGRASYNVMAEARETGINIIEAGHYYTEDPVCGAICSVLKKICPEADVIHFSSNIIKCI